MKQILQYIEEDSFFHHLHPLTKLVWAIAMCLVCFICSNLYFLAFVVLTNIGIAWGSKILKEALPTFKMFFVLGAFLMLFQMLFMTEGEIVFKLGNWLALTDKGVESGLLLALRMSGALIPLSLMLMLTSVNDLAAELVEKLHIPYKYTFVMTTALRFIPTFAKEMDQIIQAQVCRGCDLDSKNFFKKAKVIIPMSIPLLVSSVRKIEKQAMALEIKGFDAPNRSRYREVTAGKGDLIMGVYIILLMLISILIQL
ncbi:cobalt ABC transporter [Sporanaerobium hydrogeniformans]|uniref:Cobalt ABC transporter n=1 Tax=Sporanaerobium hydrogeniformans TaxID=3072179 RepID=A0AC61D8W1_9FIRM|nr:energy-coupling factor transporter transmembrane component T [Sporanaerobium hydrogeniformans]PHV69193.1 cobalt ABC transporter [Sporanaerobium hydrogeniformans]